MFLFNYGIVPIAFAFVGILILFVALPKIIQSMTDN